MNSFKYIAPHSLEEAINLGQSQNAFYLAGGTDLLIKVKSTKIKPELLVDLKAIPGLAMLEEQDDAIVIGSLVTIRDIETSSLINHKLPILAQAAGKLGSVQVRNRATVGGNLCNAAPSAETAPALLCLDASIEIAGVNYSRTVAIEEFFLGPGQTVLKTNEIMRGVFIRTGRGKSGGVYYKHSVRKAMDIAFVGVAVYLELDGNRIEKARIGLGAVAPTPIRARKAEILLEGQQMTGELAERAGIEAAQESSPISDLRASADYRREIVQALTQKGLIEAYAKALAGTRKER
jgi:carbon-monoxide dehydrogenase medium subunit